MAADVYQQPKVYLIVGEHQELIEKIKLKLAEQPLVEVYVLRPQFFLHPEFASNPIWQKKIERIFWLITSQEKETWAEQNKIIRAVGAKLITYQAKLKILFLNYSSPPLKTSEKVEEIVLRWRQQSWWESDWRIKLALEMPQAVLVIGYDVLFDSRTQEAPVGQMMALVKKEIWPVWEKGNDFYWQLADDFFAEAWRKLFSPLKARHFVLRGKRLAAEKTSDEFDGLLSEIKGYGLKKVSGDQDRTRKQILQTQIRTWEEIEVKSSEGQASVWRKWGTYLDLALKQPQKRTPKINVNKAGDFEEVVTNWRPWPKVKAPKVTDKALENSGVSEVEIVVIPEKKEVRKEKKKQIKKSVSHPSSSAKKNKAKKELETAGKQVEELQDKIQSAMQVFDEALPSPSERKQKKAKKRLGIALCSVGAGVILLVGAGWLYWQGVESRYYQQLESILSNCWQSSTSCDWEEEARRLDTLEENLKEQRRIYQLITATEEANQDLEIWKEIIAQLAKITQNSEQIKQATQDIYLGIVGRGNRSWRPLDKWQILTDLSWQNEQASLKMSSLLNQVEGKGWQIDNFVEEVKKNLTLEKEKNLKIVEEMQFWREIWGRKGEVNYALVLFNPAQLRPAGGTMEAVVVIKLIDGEIKSVVPYSLAEIEQAVKTKPLASGFEEEYLGLSRGMLREIGRDVDFELSASKIKWYLDQAMLGRKIDGLIGINMEVVVQEIERGEVFEIEPERKLNKQNYSIEQERVVKVKDIERQNFYKNLLTSVVQEKMLYAGGEAMTAFEGLAEQKEKRGLMLWMEEPTLEEKVKKAGWSGAVLEVNCQLAFGTNNCVTDSFYYGISSLGESDGRTGLRIVFKEDVLVGGDAVVHKIVINVSQTDKKDYVFDLYWPQKSTNRALSINGEDGGGKWGNGVLLSFDGKKTEQVIELSYELKRPSQKEVGESFYYSYLQGKMSGLDGVKTELNLINNSGQQIKLVAPKAEITTEGLRFEDLGESEMFVTVEF